MVIAGSERLTVDYGVGYTFDMMVDVETGRRGRWTATGKQLSVVFTLPERHALDHYGDGRLALPPAQVADAIARYVADDGAGAVADHDTMARVVDRFVADGGAHDEVGRARIEDARRVLAADLEARRAQTLAAHYTNRIGAGDVEGWRVTERGAQADLPTVVVRELEALVPGAVDATPGVLQGLITRFGAGRSPAGIDNMLSRDGYRAVLSIGRENYTVRVIGTFVGPAEPLGRFTKAGPILQHYVYTEHGVASSRTHSWRAGPTVEAPWPAAADPKLGVRRARSRTVRTGATTQITDIQRADSFGPGVLLFRRDVRLHVSVEGPRGTRAPVELDVSFVHVVPADLAPEPGGAESGSAPPGGADAAAATGSVARPVWSRAARDMVVEGVEADLVPALDRVLAGDGWPVGIDEFEGFPLSARALAPQLLKAMEPEGAELPRVPVRGRPGRFVSVRLLAHPVQPLGEVVRRKDVGVGWVIRNQRTITGSASTGVDPAATDASVSLSGYGTVNGGASPGTTSTVGTAAGKRLENSMYDREDAETWRVLMRAGFVVTLERDDVRAGTTTVLHRRVYRDLADFEAVLTVHGRTQPDAGEPDLDTGPWRPLPSSWDPPGLMQRVLWWWNR
jgi:hypothetical protein